MWGLRWTSGDSNDNNMRIHTVYVSPSIMMTIVMKTCFVPLNWISMNVRSRREQKVIISHCQSQFPYCQSMPYIQDLSRNISELGFLTTLLGNSFLIYLTGWMTQQIQGTYKHMIIIFACFGLAFSIVEMMARPFVHSYNGAFVYFSLAKEISELIDIVTFLLASYAGLYATLISFVAVQFIYRFLVLTS